MARAALRIEATASPSSWMGGISKDTGRDEAKEAEEEEQEGTSKRDRRAVQ